MTSKRVTALLLVTVLLVSAIGGVASVAMAESSDSVVTSHDDEETTHESPMNETEPADEAYVTEDGDVIVVYDYEDAMDDGEIASGHAGVDVSEGLAHYRMQSEEIDTNTTGQLTLWASPDEVAANGSLSAPQPEWLTSLDTDIESVQNETTNRGSMEMDAAISLDGDASVLAMVQRAGTSGFVETTPTSLESNGSANVELALGMGADQRQHVVLTESEDSYTLAAEQSYVLESRYGEDPTEGWDSRAAARETLRNEFCPDGDTEGVPCSISIDEYALSDENRLDLDYTVTYDGLDAKISEAIVEGLTTSQTNTTEAEATALADRVENVTLSRVEADIVSEGGETSVSWNVSLDGNDDLTLAYAGFLDAVEQSAMATSGSTETAMMGGPFGTSPGDLAEQLRTQVEASRAADLRQSTQWNLSFTTDRDTAQLNGTATSQTTNWATYIDELQANDGTVPASTAMALDVETTGDRLELDGSATVADEDLLQGMVESYNETLSQSDVNTTELTEAMDAIGRADFTRARMDIGVEDRVTYEGAVAVENATALSAQLPEPYASIDNAYTTIDEGRTTVRLEDAVDGDADASDVRELALVDEETEISLAGEWDRSFESLDTDYVESYLELNTSDGDSDDLPVVVLAGGGLALTAAAGGGIVLFRRLP